MKCHVLVLEILQVAKYLDKVVCALNRGAAASVATMVRDRSLAHASVGAMGSETGEGMGVDCETGLADLIRRTDAVASSPEARTSARSR